MFYILKKSLAEKVIRIVSIWLVLIQVVSLGTLIITTDNVEDKGGWELTTEGMLDISQNGNILVFVLDKFDGRIMDEILEDNPDFLEPLNDFTYYTNATSEFYPTACSIPYLLSGTEYDEENSSYASYACQGDDVLIKRLYEKGYDIGLYTLNYNAIEPLKDIISNSKEGVVRTCNTMDLASLMIQTSKYKMSPFISKDYFIYDTTDVTQLTATDDITNIDNDLPFYKRLTSKGLSINEGLAGGAYKFYHMHGAHSPFIMTDEFQSIDYDARREDSWGDNLSQSRGAMKIVYEYISQLKQLGAYDASTIIITADHGTAGKVVKDNGESIQQSLPIMFVKMPYDSSDEIVISEAPVAHEDLISTIRNVSGIDSKARVITDYSEDDDRVRISRVRSGSTDIKYEIDGNVRDVESWSTIYER
jgi:hypothetical protein